MSFVRVGEEYWPRGYIQKVEDEELVFLLLIFTQGEGGNTDENL